MKERPILFNDAMVRAIIEGRKTQTRRPFKLPKWVHPDEAEDFVAAINKYGGSCAKRGPCDGSRIYTGPFGGVGDRLWVRECYAEVHPCQAEGRYSQEGRAGIPGPPPVPYRVIYRADGPMAAPVRHTTAFPYRELDPGATEHLPGDGGVWTPSIHMPRWASRLTLEVESVRIERLHEITEDGAKAEGVKPPSDDDCDQYDERKDWTICPKCGGSCVHLAVGANLGAMEVDCRECDTYRKRFCHLWRSIYGTDTERGDYGWNANPLVWVRAFKVVSQ